MNSIALDMSRLSDGTSSRALSCRSGRIKLTDQLDDSLPDHGYKQAVFAILRSDSRSVASAAEESASFSAQLRALSSALVPQRPEPQTSPFVSGHNLPHSLVAKPQASKSPLFWNQHQNASQFVPIRQHFAATSPARPQLEIVPPPSPYILVNPSIKPLMACKTNAGQQALPKPSHLTSSPIQALSSPIKTQPTPTTIPSFGSPIRQSNSPPPMRLQPNFQSSTSLGQNISRDFKRHSTEPIRQLPRQMSVTKIIPVTSGQLVAPPAPPAAPKIITPSPQQKPQAVTSPLRKTAIIPRLSRPPPTIVSSSPKINPPSFASFGSYSPQHVPQPVPQPAHQPAYQPSTQPEKPAPRLGYSPQYPTCQPLQQIPEMSQSQETCKLKHQPVIQPSQNGQYNLFPGQKSSPAIRRHNQPPIKHYDSELYRRPSDPINFKLKGQFIQARAEEQTHTYPYGKPLYNAIDADDYRRPQDYRTTEDYSRPIYQVQTRNRPSNNLKADSRQINKEEYIQPIQIRERSSERYNVPQDGKFYQRKVKQEGMAGIMVGEYNFPPQFARRQNDYSSNLQGKQGQSAASYSQHPQILYHPRYQNYRVQKQKQQQQQQQIQKQKQKQKLRQKEKDKVKMSKEGVTLQAPPVPQYSLQELANCYQTTSSPLQEEKPPRANNQQNQASERGRPDLAAQRARGFEGQRNKNTSRDAQHKPTFYQGLGEQIDRLSREAEQGWRGLAAKSGHPYRPPAQEHTPIEKMGSEQQQSPLTLRQSRHFSSRPMEDYQSLVRYLQNESKDLNWVRYYEEVAKVRPQIDAPHVNSENYSQARDQESFVMMPLLEAFGGKSEQQMANSFQSTNIQSHGKVFQFKTPVVLERSHAPRPARAKATVTKIPRTEVEVMRFERDWNPGRQQSKPQSRAQTGKDQPRREGGQGLLVHRVQFGTQPSYFKK